MNEQVFVSNLDMCQRHADRWQKFREMRNQFAHDYPDDPAIQASLLNKGFDLAEALLSELETIKTFAGPYLSNASTGSE